MRYKKDVSVSDEPVVVGSCNVATLGNPVKKMLSLACVVGF